MKFFHSKELGFNKEAVVEVKLPNNDSIHREAFRNLLQDEPSIEAISFGVGAPISSSGINVGLVAPQLPNDTEYITKVIPSDKNYRETYEMEILAGRWFLSSEERNLGTAVVINRTLAELLGYHKPEQAIGNTIELGLNSMRPIIVGVTEDFHTSSLHQDIPSVALLPFPYFYYAAGIKINPRDMRNTLETVEAAWKQIYPESVYEATFVDETLVSRYKQENQNYQIFKAFSFISIFISCIGLWGLISYVVVRRTKEIGIRKILGASVSGIVVLLTKDFLTLIAIALLIASPLAWYFMNEWLQDFAYRINIGWLIFATAGFFTTLIAFFTISFQTIKAAMSNPIKNLRIE